MKFLQASRHDLYDTIKASGLIVIFQPLVRLTFGFIDQLGRMLAFTRDFGRWLFQRPYRWGELLTHMETIGVRSIPIIALTGLFTGMVFGLQTGYSFRLFNAENLVGATLGLALTREIAPVFTALMLTARMGSSMAAEIGSMRVTEQIDALESMAVNPMHFLVVPRIVATTLMSPLLCALFIYIGVAGGYVVTTKLLGIHPFYFMQNLEYYVDDTDLYQGLIKAACFGFLLSLISCYRGYTTKGGSKGVGTATTTAVVISSVVILISDYFLTAWILEIFPDV